MERIFTLILSSILCIPPGDSMPQTKLVCPNKLQAVGRFCYHFSDDSKSWTEAREACEQLGETGGNLNVMLATLDITGVPQDNQDLLTVIRDTGYKYWLGGHMKDVDDKAHWKWLDNRPIHMTSGYWRDEAPTNTKDKGCSLVSTYSKHLDRKKVHTRATLTDNDCNEEFRYICHAACPKGFQLIGQYCYYFSSENMDTGKTWNEARKYCQDKSADLAVMGLDLYNDQKMLDIIGNAGKEVWLGGSDRGKDSSWFWLDGRPIPLESYMWAADAPRGSVIHDVLIANVIPSANGDEKAVLEDSTSSEERHFVCQLIYTPPNGQMYVPVETGQVLAPSTGQVTQTGQIIIPSNGRVTQTGQVVIPATGQVPQIQLVSDQGASAQMVSIPGVPAQAVPLVQAIQGVPTITADGRVQAAQTLQIVPSITVNGKGQAFQTQDMPVSTTGGRVQPLQILQGVPTITIDGIVQPVQTIQGVPTVTTDSKGHIVPMVQTLQGFQNDKYDDKSQKVQKMNKTKKN